MKRYYIALFIFILIITSCRDSSEKSGDGMRYDQFRGDKSSIVNITQYESLSKCFEEFNFSNYKEKTIKYSINAANDQVYDQVKILLNKKIIDQNITIVDSHYNKENELEYEEYDFDLQFNVICGGYYFNEGFILKNYKSITRIIMLEEDVKSEKTKYKDSENKTFRYLTPDFSELFKLFIYLWISITILIILYIKLRKKN